MSTGGQAIGGVVGGIAGFFISGGNPTGALYGAQAGMMLGGLLDPPKIATVDGPHLNDLTVQTSTYGADIPRAYGTIAVNGNVFWLENNHLAQKVKKVKSGGKGGSSKPPQRQYSYSATFAVGICAGPIIGIRRLWVGPNLVYDAGTTDLETIVASNQASSGWTLYKGTDTQLPDARIQATIGVENTPAWRGLAYLVFEDLQLAKYGNSLMGAQVRAEVVVDGVYDNAQNLTQSSAVGFLVSGPWWDASANHFYALRRDNTSDYRFGLSNDMLSWSYSSTATLPPSVGTACCFKYSGLYCIAGRNNILTSSDMVVWNVAYNWYYNTWSWAWSLNINNGVLLIEDAQGSNPFYPSSLLSCFITDIEIEGSYGFMDHLFVCSNPPAYNGIIVLLSGHISSTPAIYTSTTGIGAWTSKTVPAGITNIYGVCAFGSSFLMIGYDFSTNTGKSAISTDGGDSWTSWVNLPIIVGGGWWQYPAWNGSKFGVAHSGSRYWLSSSDGLNWVSQPLTGNGVEIPKGPTKAWNGSYWGAAHSSYGFQITDPGSQIQSISPTLASVVMSECLLTGILTNGDVDASSLSSAVRGYLVGRSMSIRSAIEPLQAAWPFDVRQHGYQIQFVARGGSSVVMIPASDLDARGHGDSPGVQITTIREMDSQLPRRLTVRYLDYDREYDVGSQYSERLNTPAMNLLILDLPIVLTSAEAAGKAEVLLYLYWMERYDVVINLPSTYNHIEPGDVVTLATPEGNLSLRLVGVTLTSDGRVECKAKYANAAIYTPTALGASPAVTGPTTIVPAGASVYHLLDVPQMLSAQAGPSFLAAMTGALAEWEGGTLLRSSDAGSTWDYLYDFYPPGATIGVAGTPLTAVDSRTVDNASRLDATLTKGVLYSVTRLAMFGGENHMAYGRDGRWEIIAAQNCTLVSGTTYVLSDLLRGRFGTEWTMSLHLPGDYLVLLDTVEVAKIETNSSNIGLSHLYRGITVNRDIDTDSNKEFIYRGVNLRPLSPISLTGNRDSSNNWTLFWIRRTRDGGEWRDYVDASLGEVSESYQIDIHDSTYSILKRTISTNTPSATYSSADQIADFSSNQSTLYLKIYQLSAIVGRGYPLTTTITR